MTNARGYGQNGQALYSNVSEPVCSFLQFTVTPTNGLGVTSVKSNGYVNNVFMHTSTTPAAGNGLTNPNPASGYALIQMKQNLNVFLGMTASFTAPSATATKVDNDALTVGQVYTISTLGNTTTANWRLLGVPAGVTPAVGVAFTALIIGTAGAANTSTSRVMLPSSSGIVLVEAVGLPNVNVTSTIASNGGQWLTLKFSSASTVMSSYTPAGTNNSATPPIFTGTPATLTATTSLAAAAPAAGSILQAQLWFDKSSVTIDGL